MHQLETINKDKFFAYIYTEIFEEINNKFTLKRYGSYPFGLRNYRNYFGDFSMEVAETYFF